MIIIRALVNLTQLLLQLLDPFRLGTSSALPARRRMVRATASSTRAPLRTTPAASRRPRLLLLLLDVERPALALDDELVELPDGTWWQRVNVDLDFVAVLRARAQGGASERNA